MFNVKAFGPGWVDNIHKISSQYVDEQGDITLVNSVSGEKVIDREKYFQRWINPNKEPQLVNQLESLVFRANKELYGYDIWLRTEAIQYTTYDSKQQGEFPLHTDTQMYGYPSTQKLTLIVGLTPQDNYEGGQLEIHISKQPISIKLMAGQAVVFPSSFPHRVTPVTRGVRHTLVSWYSGPMWR